jgi:ribonuclease HI
MIKIYTDGSSRGNPGPGGFGVVMISGTHRKEISKGFRLTTNNRMELLSVIEALESLKKDGLEIEVYSDSKYVVDAVEKKWVFKWQKTGFKDKKNPDLWKRFLILYPRNKIRFKWIKGHNNHEENEYCDRLAVNAAMSKGLPPDEGYENSIL